MSRWAAMVPIEAKEYQHEHEHGHWHWHWHGRWLIPREYTAVADKQGVEYQPSLFVLQSPSLEGTTSSVDWRWLMICYT